ncbi:uncharacterized protein EV154DRAFT_132622 [Mucor mucedo]|uniref:uncharacterized protein n=1 Tax=Mucor mucedo TaxID=29922 RepID=UPI002220E6EE|nr:uncharacterized protein EV154DRAFT_132622 [Mucor mucedo]KAI7893791.1 hypothetical protein EV154DRAFT_132622 [Mucor mucedo]
MVPATPSQQSFKAMSNAFRKGVQYNMKIVLRGDVMTGKTNLFNRLQGSDFDENYISTPQIQVANIPWHYKDSNDIVKIEVWDVVDKAHNKTKATENKGIKLEHNSAEAETPVTIPSPSSPNTEDSSLGLDASTVNVYRNSHGAIFLFDTTKPWTFDYVNTELANVPETISVLVLGNFSDKVQERKVELDTIHATLYEHNQDRIKKGAIKPNLIRYAETSMQSGLGLKYIYEYLGVPFLQLMIESLNKQLELKAVEIVDLLEVLDKDDDVPEGMQRRRGQDNFDQPSEPRLARQQEELQSAWDQELEDIALDHSTMLSQPISFDRSETPPPPTQPVKSKKKKDVRLVSEEIPAVVDHFTVEEELEDDWFGEETALPANLSHYKHNESDDDGPGNPMVAGDEDVEPAVEFYSKQNNVLQIHPKDDDDEESQPYEDAEDIEEEVAPVVESYRPPIFKSELDDVWSRSLRRLSGPEIISDSEDEDNRVLTTDSPYLESPSFNFGGSGEGYEEIGGANDNPWSTGQKKEEQEVHEVHQSWDEPKNDENITQEEELPPKGDDNAPVAPSKKKKSSSKKKSSKKKASK